MGDPKKRRKQYEKPLRPWDKARLERERGLKKNYGLKNKKELWRVEKILREKRKNARKLLAMEAIVREIREKELVGSLAKYGIVNTHAGLDDILGISIESFLERRLATMVLRKNLARTIKQARQIVVHGHIGVKGKKVNRPSYLVRTVEEDAISYYGEPIILENPQAVKEKTKKDFEEALPEGEGEEIEETAEEAEPETVEAEGVEPE